jgi:hypothetical protein
MYFDFSDDPCLNLLQCFGRLPSTPTLAMDEITRDAMERVIVRVKVSPPQIHEAAQQSNASMADENSDPQEFGGRFCFTQ